MADKKQAADDPQITIAYENQTTPDGIKLAPGSVQVDGRTPLRDISYDYEFFAPPGSYNPNLTVPENPARVLVIEPSYLGTNVRHGQAASHAARMAAERASESANVGYRADVMQADGAIHDSMIEKGLRLTPLKGMNIGQEGTEIVADKVANADVISISYGRESNDIQGYLLQRYNSTSLGLVDKITNPELNMTTHRFPIIVQAEGNEGHRFAGVQYDHADQLQTYPYSVEVGAASRGSDGQLAVEGYSTHSGPTLLAVSPYDKNGGKIAYNIVDSVPNPHRDEEGVMARIKEQYHDFRQGRQDARLETHDGYEHKIEGTSFAAPWVAGNIGAQKQLHPELSNPELMTALTSSTDPVYQVEGKGAAITHVDTVTGKPFDPVYSGWGVMNESRFAENAEKMAQLLRENPELSRADHTLSSTNATTLVTNKHGGTTLISINVPAHESGSDTTVTQTAVSVDMDSGTWAPRDIYLISPSGTRMIVPYAKSSTNIVASTSGFTGEQGNGEWKLEMPDGAKVNKTELTLHGVERGGLIDRFLEVNNPGHQQQQGKGGIDIATPKDAKQQNPVEEIPPPVPAPLGPFGATEQKPELDKLIAEANVPKQLFESGPTLPSGSTDLGMATTAGNLSPVTGTQIV